MKTKRIGVMVNKKFWIRFSVMMAIIAAILVLDLVTKYVFDATLSFNESKTIIPHLFNFKLVHNIGAAWGVLAGKQVFLIALTLVFLAIFIAYYVKEKNKTWFLNVTFGFLMGGCLGNLYDRIFVGYVRDFIQFDFWQSFPIFNFADVALTVGVVLFVIYLVLYFVRIKKEEKNAGIKIENFDSKKENISLAQETTDDEVQKDAKNTAKKGVKKPKKTEQNAETKKLNVQNNAKKTPKMQKNDEILNEEQNINKSNKSKHKDEGGQ